MAVQSGSVVATMFTSRLSRAGIVASRSIHSNPAKSSINFCMSLLKQHDFDSYLAGLLVHRDFRDLYFSVRAFNVEIALIKDQARGNNLAGKIRYQWWKDFFDNIYSQNSDRSPDHPVGRALVESSKRHRLSRSWLERSLQARERDFLVENYENLDELETYCEQAHSSVLYLLLDGIAMSNDECYQLTSHIGVASGLVTFMRSVPSQFAQGNFGCFPIEVMEKHKYHPLHVRSPGPDLPLENIMFDIASQANGHLEKGLDMLGKNLSNKDKNLQSFLRGPVVRSKQYLHALQQSTFNPCTTEMIDQNFSQMRYQIRILNSKLLGKL